MRHLTAQDHTEALGGDWRGHVGLAPCPVCQPERRPDQRALSIRDGDGLLRYEVFCHEGCEPGEIVDALLGSQVWSIRHIGELQDLPERRDQPRPERAKALEERRLRQAQSLRLWDESVPLEGSPGEAHLRALGITGSLPSALRFHGSCWHPYGPARPAIVALGEDGPWRLVNIAYLPSRPGEAHPADHPEVFLGAAGVPTTVAKPPAGQGAPFVVAERLEAALSLAEDGVLPAPLHVLAAFSSDGLAKLRLPEEYQKGWISPADPGCLVIACEANPESRRAAHHLANRARAAGWQACIVPAPEGQTWAARPRKGLAALAAALETQKVSMAQQQAEAEAALDELPF